MLALTRDVTKRYQSAEEMARALRKLLAVQFSDFGPSDLATFVKKLFHETIVEDRKQLQSLNGRAEELIALGNSIVSPIAPPIASVHSHNPPDSKEHTRITNLGNKFDKSQITGADRVELAPQPRNQMKVPARSASLPQNTASHLRAAMSISRPTPVDVDTSSGGGFLKFLFFLAILGGGGYYGYSRYLVPHSNVNETHSTESQSAPVSQASTGKIAQLKLRLFPDGDISHTRVTVNSAPYDLATGTGPVSVGDLVAIVVERPGFVTFHKEFTIKASELIDDRDYNLDVKLEPMVYGTFTLSTQPEVADVTIINLDQGSSGESERPVVLKTPIYQEKLPVGHYKVIVKNELLNVEKVFQIEIKEGDRMVKNSLPLEPSRIPATNR